MRVSALILGMLLSLAAGSKEQVSQFTGSGGATTAEFEVQAPWILDWRVNSDFQGSMAIEISLVDGSTGFHKGLILQTKRPGNGVKLFRESGRYRFRISSTLARWDLKVEELSREEAELYTPRGD
jgi:hypothetical protein